MGADGRLTVAVCGATGRQGGAVARRLLREGWTVRALPVWLLDRFTRKDLSVMWRWLRTHEFEVDPAETRSVLPSALTVREWLTLRGEAAPGRLTRPLT